MSRLCEDKTKISTEDFEEEIKALDADETMQCLLDLSILELCLIIAMKHHIEIYDSQAMNFEMIFTRYSKFVSANSSVQIAQRPVVLKAFEHLKVISKQDCFTCCLIALFFSEYGVGFFCKHNWRKITERVPVI